MLVPGGSRLTNLPPFLLFTISYINLEYWCCCRPRHLPCGSGLRRSTHQLALPNVPCPNHRWSSLHYHSLFPSRDSSWVYSSETCSTSPEVNRQPWLKKPEWNRSSWFNKEAINRRKSVTPFHTLRRTSSFLWKSVFRNRLFDLLFILRVLSNRLWRNLSFLSWSSRSSLWVKAEIGVRCHRRSESESR